MNTPHQTQPGSPVSTLISLHVRGTQATDGACALVAAIAGRPLEEAKHLLSQGDTLELQPVDHLNQAQAWRRTLERMGFEVRVTQRPLRKPGVLATVSFGLLGGGLFVLKSEPLFALACVSAGLVLALKAGQAQRWSAQRQIIASPEPLGRLKPLYQTILGLRLPEALLHDVLKDLRHLAMRFENLESLRASGLTRLDAEAEARFEAAMTEAENVLTEFERSLTRFETTGAVSDAQGALQQLVDRIQLLPGSGENGSP
jgi:hypothetical protein